MIPAPAAPPPAYAPPTQYQQAAPPPAEYQQQSSAAAPPAYGAPPQNGYPPPPPQNYYPPQGQGYPPPPPGAGYPPPPPQGLAQRRGFLALPFLGINSFQGSTGENFGPGLRLGVLLGGHINEMFSANGELTIDPVNLKNIPSGTDASQVDVVLAFSPLVHIPFGNAELAVGPKLGVRSGQGSFAVNGAEATTSRFTGFVFGVNAGVFAAVSNTVSLGGLLSADIRTVSKFCFTEPGFSEACSTADSETGTSDKVIGISGAALF